MSRTRKEVEARAQEILNASGAALTPVPLDLVLRYLGLAVQELPMENEVSGVLAIDADGGTIACNALHPRVRQRFTIAHEIGHFVLHRSDDELFIDTGYVVLKRQKAARGADLREIEANQFATALLMPRDLLEHQIAQLGFDLVDEKELDAIARLFEVSRAAMTYRIAQLGFL